MSDQPQKCYEMVRLENIEKIVGKVQSDMVLVREKIFDGFSDSIKSTEDKVNYIDERNREDHEKVFKSIDKLSDKFDKMLWLWASVPVSIVIGIIIYVVKDYVL